MRRCEAKVVVSVAAGVVGVGIVVELGSLEKEGPTLVECGSLQATVGQKLWMPAVATLQAA